MRKLLPSSVQARIRHIGTNTIKDARLFVPINHGIGVSHSRVKILAILVSSAAKLIESHDILLKA
jgi:hypothetical protein